MQTVWYGKKHVDAVHYRPLPGRRKNVMSLAVGLLELSLDFITATSKRVGEVTGLITAACYSSFFRQVFFCIFFSSLVSFCLLSIGSALHRLPPTPLQSISRKRPITYLFSTWWLTLRRNAENLIFELTDRNTRKKGKQFFLREIFFSHGFNPERCVSVWRFLVDRPRTGCCSTTASGDLNVCLPVMVDLPEVTWYMSVLHRFFVLRPSVFRWIFSIDQLIN